MSELPEGWAKCQIGDVTSPITKGAPDAEFTYIDIASINNSTKAITEPKQLPPEKAPSRARQHLRTGDVLVSMTRPNLNAVALVPDCHDGAIGSTGFDVLRGDGVTPEWLFSHVRSPRFVGEMTRKVQGINRLHGHELLRINPEDAAGLGICEKDRVRIVSRRGETTAVARLTQALPPGTVSMTFHFAETPVNVLTSTELDADAKIPELKLSAVNIVKIA